MVGLPGQDRSLGGADHLVLRPFWRSTSNQKKVVNQ